MRSSSVPSADGSVYKTETFTRNPLGQPEKIVSSNLTEVWAGSTTDPAAASCDLTGTDPDLKKQTTAVFNDFGWQVKETDPLGNIWTASHDRHGNVLTATDAKGQTTVLTWTTGHQLASRTVRNADGSVYKTETFTRNPLGQPEKIVSSNPVLTETRSYDAAHRVVGITDSRGNKTLTHHWSPGGLLNMVEDSDGHRTDYLYDGVGRLIGIWAPNFDYLAFSHDAGGRLTEKWFPNGTTARYAWNPDDSLAELTNRTAANSVLSSHQYQYDTLGRRTRHVETIGSLGTKYLQYGFDALSRLTAAESCTGSAYSTCTADETLTYDIWDNRKTRTAAGSTLAYVYDNAHQLKETRSGSDTGTLIASYAWDANGNLTSRGGQTLAWTPDDRLAGIGAESYAYDPQGRRIQKTVSGQSTSWRYNGPDIHAEWNAAAPSGAPQAVYTHGPAWDDPLIRTSGSTSGPDAVARYYHADGLSSAVAMSGNSQTRINAAAGRSVTQTAGSLYSGGYGFAKLTDGDRKGANPTAGGLYAGTSGSQFELAFDGSKEIEQIDLFLGQSNYTAPVEPTPAMTVTNNIDVSKLTVEYWTGTAWANVAGSPVSGNVKVWVSLAFAPVSTTKLRVTLVDDASNNVQNNDNVVTIAEIEAWTTPEGGGSQLQRFDAWGNQTQTVGAAIPQYGYTGREPDQTGLIYYRARYYDPQIGRFISRDPAGMPDGVNRFAYVLNNPVNHTDPTGEFIPQAIGFVVGFGGELAGQYIESRITGREFNPDYGRAAVSGVAGAAGVGLVGLGNRLIQGTRLAGAAGRIGVGAAVEVGSNIAQAGLNGENLSGVGIGLAAVLGGGSAKLGKLAETGFYASPAARSASNDADRLRRIAGSRIDDGLPRPGRADARLNAARGIDDSLERSANFLSGATGSAISLTGSLVNREPYINYFSNMLGTGGSGNQTLLGASPRN